MIAVPKQVFETDANKALFAEALLRNPIDAFKAAKTIFPKHSDNANALYVSTHWPNDDFVLAKQKEFLRAEAVVTLRAAVCHDLL